MTQRAFKALQKKWYNKLEEKGFVDAEAKPELTHGHLKQSSSIFQLMNTPAEYQEKERFFQLATQMLNDFKFRSKKERHVWESFCNGEGSYIYIGKRWGLHEQEVYRIVKYYSSFIKR